MQIVKEKSEETTPIATRIPTKIYNKIKKEAKSKDVSVASALTQVIVYWSEKYLTKEVKKERSKIVKGNSSRNEGYASRGAK